jgi:hypothetical protein
MAKHCVPSLQPQNATGRQSRSPQQLAPAGSLSSEYQSCPLALVAKASRTTLGRRKIRDGNIVWHMTAPNDQLRSVEKKIMHRYFVYH